MRATLYLGRSARGRLHGVAPHIFEVASLGRRDRVPSALRCQSGSLVNENRDFEGQFPICRAKGDDAPALAVRSALRHPLRRALRARAPQITLVKQWAKKPAAKQAARRCGAITGRFNFAEHPAGRFNAGLLDSLITACVNFFAPTRRRHLASS